MLGSTGGADLWPLAVSPDGSLLATVGADRLVRVWDVAGREELRQLTGHSAFTRGVGFSPDGATLYTCSDDGTVRAWPARGWPGAGQIASRRCR
ncbi:hypothetical protein NE857_18915 [Nocardiopsis exhalans]|uniref:WD domain-containing protein, G-beta repeat-containing protein n=1 Tax=Nocardiopsis exhalans TaxID=163604 RepID=A0ABY5D0I0_9ACTN|nr:hypothetical protein [Nocardiopsis exhalans]USY17415.1 hypothetical protein NE857_18915 [Nocardiopsis exhalans]